MGTHALLYYLAEQNVAHLFLGYVLPSPHLRLAHHPIRILRQAWGAWVDYMPAQSAYVEAVIQYRAQHLKQCLRIALTKVGQQRFRALLFIAVTR
jgi:hypothetical protein